MDPQPEPEGEPQPEPEGEPSQEEPPPHPAEVSDTAAVSTVIDNPSASEEPAPKVRK